MPKPATPPSSASRFRIGDALVQPDRLVVQVEGIDHPIEPKVMEVLLMLAEYAGETVSAEQIVIAVWREKDYGDNPVHKAITHLRSVFGDSPRAPRYIETIRKRGYRLIAPVSYPGDYRRISLKIGEWRGGSPFVGLSAFDRAHAEVFCGRSRTTAELLGAMRRQIDLQHRFVLMVGASGCGKTSLLQAGALPKLQQEGGFDGLQTLSYAHCDLAGVEPANATTVLAGALAQWRLGAREVFAPQPAADFAAQLDAHPERLADIVGDAFRRHASRDLAERAHAHLLLCIDHAESLVSEQAVDGAAIRAFGAALHALCETPRILVVMIVRGDFYLKLVEALPDIAERKGGDGHVDVLTPRPGEIAEIIRAPATLAGLSYERDAQTSLYLDDVLRDAASAQPDALPLLQHALQALYERRDASGRLLFSAYHAIGGLEGALAHRAEEVFATLPDAAQRSLDGLLSQIVVVQPENDSISARRVVLSALDNDARLLAEAFVRARLFVAELDDGTPILRVAHEALLRQWPRARDWAQDNRRLLQARVRLQRAAARWVEEGRRDDHLLNPGRPLGEALEVVATFPEEIAIQEHEFVGRSQRAFLRVRNSRRAMVIGLFILTIVSMLLFVFAKRAQERETQRRAEAQKLASFILGEVAENLRDRGDVSLLSRIGSEVSRYLMTRGSDEMNQEELITLSRSYASLGEALMKGKRMDDAYPAVMRSLSMAMRSVSTNPRNLDAINQAGQSSYWAGFFYFKMKDYDKARKFWGAYATYSKVLIDSAPANLAWKMEYSYAINNLGSIEKATGHLDSAIAQFQKSLQLKRQLLEFDRSVGLKIDYAESMSWISSTLESMGRIRESAQWREYTINSLKKFIKETPLALELTRTLAKETILQARLEKRIGNISSAEKHTTESIALMSSLIEKNPDNKQWQKDLVTALIESSDIHGRMHSAKIQQRDIEKAISIINENASLDPFWNRSRLIAETEQTSTITSSIDSADRCRINSSLLLGIYNNTNDTSAIVSAVKGLILAASHYRNTGNIESAKIMMNSAYEILSPAAESSTDIAILEPWIRLNHALGRNEQIQRTMTRLDAAGLNELTAALKKTNAKQNYCARCKE